ncbi:PIN domain-containing protein [soil metagenome]
MRIALDSNVIIYAEGLTDSPKRNAALDIIDAIPAMDLLIPFQVVGETLRWLVVKGRLPKPEAAERAARWTLKYPTQQTDLAVFQGACELISRHGMQVWDAIILSASSQGGASVLLSEDMQDSFHWRGVTIANPFAARPSGIIQDILNKIGK